MLTTKQLADLIKSPQELRFREAETILYNYGFKLISSKGSHFRFKRKGFTSITVVVHRNRVKKWYVRRMAKIILSHLPHATYEKETQN